LESGISCSPAQPLLVSLVLNPSRLQQTAYRTCGACTPTVELVGSSVSGLFPLSVVMWLCRPMTVPALKAKLLGARLPTRYLGTTQVIRQNVRTACCHSRVFIPGKIFLLLTYPTRGSFPFHVTKPIPWTANTGNTAWQVQPCVATHYVLMLGLPCRT
jgi:hypothetical protein